MEIIIWRCRINFGPSLTLAGDQYDGKWCCGTFCFDFRLFDDGGGRIVNINPEIHDHERESGFSFQSSVVVNQGNGWHSICAPVSDCNPPPVSAEWGVDSGRTTVPNDWTTVLSNVTDVIFKVDYTAPSEISAIDNVFKFQCTKYSCKQRYNSFAGSVLTLNVQGMHRTTGMVWTFRRFIDLYGFSTIDWCHTDAEYLLCSDLLCKYWMLLWYRYCLRNCNPLPVIKWQVNYGNVCLNGIRFSLILQTFLYSWKCFVPISNLGGTITFSGIGVVGNYFYPNSLGPHLITVSFTDSLGCTSSTSITINVISCCVNTCNADAGPDQFICLGNPAILHTQGCDSSATWYSLGPEGPVLVGIGQGSGHLPSTIYVLHVDLLWNRNCCCDTDTVCITVNPAPIISMAGAIPDLFVNIRIPFIWIQQTFSFCQQYLDPDCECGRKWSIHGHWSSRNYWYPTTLGANTVTYYYTDGLGCSASVTITINVISCCVNTCNADAGPDRVICLGNLPFCILRDVIHPLPGTHWDQKDRCSLVLDRKWTSSQQSMCYMLICCGTETIVAIQTQLHYCESATDHSMAGAIPDCLSIFGFHLSGYRKHFHFRQQYLDPDCECRRKQVFTGTGVVGKLLVSDNTWCKYSYLLLHR